MSGKRMKRKKKQEKSNTRLARSGSAPSTTLRSLRNNNMNDGVLGIENSKIDYSHLPSLIRMVMSPGKPNTDMPHRGRVVDRLPNTVSHHAPQGRIGVYRPLDPSPSLNHQGGGNMICSLDIHKTIALSVIADESGREIEVKSVRANRESMKEFIQTLPRNTTILMESCYAWEYIHDIATDLKMDTKVADTYKLYPGGKSEKKNDIEDCRRMIKLYRIGELPTINVLPKEMREMRDLLRYRIFLTWKATAMKNHIHFIADRNGIKTEQFELYKNDDKKPLDMGLSRLSMVQLVSAQKVLELLEAEEKAIEGELARLLLQLPEMKRLLTIPGVGLILASVFLLEIGDIRRFPAPTKLTAYAGLVPRLEESGETTRHGRLRKRSNPYLRWAAVEAARHAIQCDPVMKEKYLRILKVSPNAATKVQKAKAVVAVARHLLEVIWCMLTRGEVYRTPQKDVPEKKMREIKRRAMMYALPLPSHINAKIRNALVRDIGMSWMCVHDDVPMEKVENGGKDYGSGG